MEWVPNIYQLYFPGQRLKWRYFADDIFKCIFLNENVWISIKISLKFVPMIRISNIPALVQIMAWRPPGDSHFWNYIIGVLWDATLEYITSWCKRYPHCKQFQNIDEKIGEPKLRLFNVWFGHLNIYFLKTIYIYDECWYACMCALYVSVRAHMYIWLYTCLYVYVCMYIFYFVIWFCFLHIVLI